MQKLFSLSKLLILLLLSLFSQFASVPIFAQESNDNFSTSVTTRYDIDEKAVARVTQEFAITNKTPTIYLSQYALKLGTDKIKSITATINGVATDPHVVQSEGQTSIAVAFDNPTIGENQTQRFTLSYVDPAVASKVGKVVEINVPKTLQDEEFSEHRLVVSYPNALGQPSRFEPPPIQQKVVGNRTEYVYPTMPEEAIVASFGNQQLFQVSIEYPLSNPNSQAITIPVALVPDTPFQRVSYTNLQPKPNKVEVDPDGNWIASYRVEGNQSISVKADAVVKTLLNPDSVVPTPLILPAHIQAKTYWESEDLSIQNAASSLTDVSDIAKYTIDTLSYTQTPLSSGRPRLGAAAALQDPTNAVCQEYTDVFIALSRAKGIPAVGVIGYAYTPDPLIKPVGLAGDILHTWPEAFDQTTKQWQRFDPTWQDTSGGLDYTTNFDLNHIVFARNGISSEDPSPAGSYDPTQPITQHVTVAIAETFPNVQPSIETTIEPMSLFKLPLPGLALLRLTNSNGSAWYPSAVTTNSVRPPQTTDSGSLNIQAILNALGLNHVNQASSSSAILPLTTTKQLLLLTSADSLPHSQPVTVTISLPNEKPINYTSTENYLFIPQAWTEITASQAIPAVGGIIVFCTIVSGSLLVWRHRRHRTVRGQGQESPSSTPELHPPQASQ